MSSLEAFTIRRANIQDADTLVAHRCNMFREMGYSDERALESMSAQFRPWLLARMIEGEYLAWLAIAPEGAAAAGAGLWLMDWPPHMIGAGARRGNILNVYTALEFRRRGLARRLMEVVLQWCGENGVDTVILHASSDGRALYESMGFEATNEMRISL